MIKFAVSSYVDYKKPREMLLESLEKCGVPKEDILVVIGGGVDVSHNSYDFTSLIYIVEKEIESDWWFLLHDTCKAGPDFYERIKKVKLVGNVIPAKRFPSSNIGFYRYDFLLKYKSHLQDGKNKPKRYFVIKEDSIFMKDKFATRPISRCQVLGLERIYGEDSVIRRIEYYTNLDLYKYKANFPGNVKRKQLTPGYKRTRRVRWIDEP